MLMKKIIEMFYNITAGCAIVYLLNKELEDLYTTIGAFFVTVIVHFLYIEIIGE